MIISIDFFFPLILPVGVAGCCYSDFLLLRPGPRILDRSWELQQFPQQRLQVPMHRSTPSMATALRLFPSVNSVFLRASPSGRSWFHSFPGGGGRGVDPPAL